VTCIFQTAVAALAGPADSARLARPATAAAEISVRIATPAFLAK